MNQYIIENTQDCELVWSNQLGWTEGFFYDVFSEEEKQVFNLPIEGKWVELK